MITNDCRLSVRASPSEKTLEIRVSPYQYRTTDNLSSQEMDCPQPIFVMEEYINFCTLYSGRSYIGSELAKIGILQLASSITPEEHHSNVRPIIQEISNEQSDEEVVNLDDESEEESKNDPIAQALSDKFPYWSDREREIKDTDIRKITSTKSYQQSPTCVRQVIMTELEINLIQE